MEGKGTPSDDRPRAGLHRGIAWAGFLALILLHLDFWRPQRAVLYFGWLPEEVAYRLVWMVLAFLYLTHHCAFLWRADEESGG